MDLFDGLFGGWAWWRKRRGGHWEYWLVASPDGTNSYHWFRLDSCSKAWDGDLPCFGCVGEPTCENWTEGWIK